MKLVKYELVDGEIPEFATDGGYHWNPDDDTLICVMADDAELPDSVTVLTPEELQERQLAIHANTPFRKAPEPAVGKFGADYDVLMSEDDVIADIESWIAER